jgi:hypothetical protein
MVVHTSWPRDLVLATILAAAFVALQIAASLNGGTLSVPPTFDDIVYYNDAASRVRILWDSGIVAVLTNYIASPPHAPGSTFLAAVGFLMFGFKPWAADIANTLPLFLFTLIIIRLFSGLPLGIMVPATIASLLIPIFGLAIVEFRPDMWAAGFTALGALLITLHDPRVTRVAVLSGLAFAAALLMKPTLSPLVIILYGAAIALRFAPHLRDRKELLIALRSCLIIGGIALILAGPHYILALQNLVEYYRSIFGSGAAMWSPSLSRSEQLLYYLTGPGGRPSLGRWVYLGALTLVAPVALFALNRRTLAWRATFVAVLATIAYTVVSVPGNKSAYLGVVFPAFAVAAIILTIAAILKALYARQKILTAYTVALALLAFAVGSYRFPWRMLHGISYPPAIAASLQSINDQVVSYLSADRDLSRKTVMFAQITQYLNESTIKFALTQGGLPMPTFVGDATDEMPKQLALLSRSHYVITVTEEYPNSLSWLPIAKLITPLNAMLGPTTGFELVKTIIPLGEPGEVRIYRRVK